MVVWFFFSVRLFHAGVISLFLRDLTDELCEDGRAPRHLGPWRVVRAHPAVSGWCQLALQLVPARPPSY